jgi:trigger factor
MSMQVVEKSSEGLSHTLQVTVPAKDLNARLDAKIAEIGPQLRLKGFRPGKVPAGHVRKVFGRELMGEIVQETLNRSSQQALDEKSLRPAAPAEVKLSSDLEKVVKGEADLAFEMQVEVMPEFTPIDVAQIELVRPVYESAPSEVETALGNLLAQSRTYEEKTGKSVKAESGDMVVIDFVGRIDGEAFAGGAGTDAQLTLGSGQFIPGFEDQLVGAKPGETRMVKVNFPDNYGVANLAGQPAEFEVTVKEVREPKAAVADEAFAERVGFESLEALRNALKVQLDQQHQGQSRFRLKRRLLDRLDAGHDFTLPAKMVEAEFGAIWRQVDADRQNGALAPEDAAKPEAELAKEYREIAERRVRLGLVLAEIGRRAGVTVTDQELGAAIMNEARAYPGREKEVVEFYRRDPNAAAQLRAPLFEEKVCDWIFNAAKVENETVSREELYEGEDEPAEAKPAKKAKPAKAKAEAAPAEKPAKEAKPEAASKAPPAEKPAKKAKAEAEASVEPAKPAKAEAAPKKAAAAKKPTEAKPAQAKPAKPAAKSAKPKA